MVFILLIMWREELSPKNLVEGKEGKWDISGK